MAGIYIHIPFCSKICPYCDFNTYALQKYPLTQYIKALIKEITQTAENYSEQNYIINSVYFGGGTPSMLAVLDFAEVLSCISDNFTLTPQPEITIEANPLDLTPEYTAAIAASSINRLSLGVQSLQDEILRTLGRTHTSSDVINAIKELETQKISNYNLDLIFAAPGSDKQSLSADLAAYLEIGPAHISAYELTFEQGTPFYQGLLRGSLKKATDDQSISYYQQVQATLVHAGYQHYEVSNYAKPGSESQHNLNYWLGNDYFGFGAGAHSCLFAGELQVRSANLNNYKSYIEATANGQSYQAHQEIVKASSTVNDRLMLGLRAVCGVRLDRFPESIAAKILKSAAKYLSADLLEYSEATQTLTATHAGWEVLDTITADLIIDDDQP